MPFDDRARGLALAPTPEVAMPLVEHRLTLQLPDGKTVLERPELRVRRLSWAERIGEPFMVRLDVIFDGDASTCASWLGAEAKLELWRGDDVRDAAGVVLRVEPLGDSRDGAVVVIEVGPALALLARTRRSRVFERLDACSIAAEVCADLLQARRRARLDTTRVSRPPTRDYCVQYDETDLAFVQRVLAEEGLAIVFTHDPETDRELAVVVDDPGALGKIASVGWLAGPPDLAAREGVAELQRRYAISVERVASERWDWTARPCAIVDAVAEHPSARAVAGEHQLLETRRPWEAEGPIALVDDLAPLADRQLRLLHGRNATCEGRSNLLQLVPGCAFELGHADPTLEGRWRVVAVHHDSDCPEVDFDAHGRASPGYRNRFHAIPERAPWMPESPPRPRVHGMQTARVVGPPGEEIHTDALGRVKVLMHWDREHRESADGASSCWLRVAQSWAGAGFGALFVPRVGMEVLVAFIDGDPDRPLVVGCLYNGQNDPPQELPEHRTRTTLRTRSSPGGDGFNELTFEDDAGRERIFVHAQRDLVEQIGSARRTTIGSNDTVSVGGSQQETVARGRSTVIGGLEDRSIMGARYTVVSAGTAPVDDDRSSRGLLAGDTLQVDGTYTMHARDLASMRAGSPMGTAWPAELQMDAYRAFLHHVASGVDSSVVLAPGGDDAGLLLQSNKRITLRVGESQLVIDPEGVRIEVASGKRIALGVGPSAADARVELTCDVAIEARAAVALKQGTSSKLTLQEGATLDAPVTAIRGAAQVSVATDGICTVEGAAVTVTSQMTCIHGTQTRITDGGGGVIEMVGGIIKLN